MTIKYRIRDVGTKKIVAYETIEDDCIYRQEVLDDGSVSKHVKTFQYLADGTREMFTNSHDDQGVEIYYNDILKLYEKWAKAIGSGRIYVLVNWKDCAFMFGRSDVDPRHMNSVLWMSVAPVDENSKLEAKCIVVGDIFSKAKLLDEILPSRTYEI